MATRAAGPRITIVLDPRFTGGTPAAVAGELRAMAGHAALRVCAIETAMFRGRKVNPTLQAALDALGLDLEWNPTVIRGDVVVFHNPSCLKFDSELPARISCEALYVVTHENLLRPSGAEGFDVAGCLRSIERAAVAGRSVLAPISPHNRRGVEAWLARTDPARTDLARTDPARTGPARIEPALTGPACGEAWQVAPFDWFNVCDFPLQPPVARPRDRRGRHSRPGFEKFPPLEVMRAHFPAGAERCTILGADAFLADPASLPRHWRALPFGAMPVARFLDELDFFVYFTHPLWRESFGRVIAEAIAAGKLVITDPGTAECFGPGVVASDGGDVDAIVARHVADPKLYARAVRQAQAALARFAPARFREAVMARLTEPAPQAEPPRVAVVRGERGAERAHALL